MVTWTGGSPALGFQRVDERPTPTGKNQLHLDLLPADLLMPTSNV